VKKPYLSSKDRCKIVSGSLAGDAFNIELECIKIKKHIDYVIKKLKSRNNGFR
jgi:hypothetical protein